MKFARRLTAIAALLAAVTLLGGHALSGEKGAKGPKGKDIESQGKPAQKASAIDFNKALGLGFESLSTLGSRIDQARLHADPVCLANLGRELSVAEQVSGKAAPLTGAAVMKEAAAMAKMRQDPNELKAVSATVTDEATAKDLATAAAAAEKAEKARIETAKEGGKSRGIMGQLHVDSRVATTITVYVDGRYVGTIPPYGDIYPYIGQTAYETTYLSARGANGLYWQASVPNAVNNFTWILR